jgi:diguanylate cyclase (GGDEF)-like protein
MTPIQHEIQRVIKETLRERGVDTLEQNFIINLFDSIIATLEINSTLNSDDMVTVSRNISDKLLSSHRLLIMLKQQAAELEILRHLSLHLSSCLDLTTLLKAVVNDAVNLLSDTRTAHIFLYDEKKDQLEFGAAWFRNKINSKGYATPRQNGITYRVARTAQRLIVPDMRKHELFTDTSWTGSILGIPLKFEDRVVGVMNISRSVTGNFSETDLRLLQLLAEQAAVAISNARLHALIRQEAKSDTLTGLPNRRALDERLEEEISSAHRTGHPFAVVMMDIDGFKEINDRYGHQIGDQVLQELFRYLASGLRNTDFLARYGGDELTLVLSQSDLSATQMVTDKMLKKLHDFDFAFPDDKKLDVGMSGGIALYPLHGQTPSALLRAADEALYRAKKHQRGFFTIAAPQSGLLG